MPQPPISTSCRTALARGGRSGCWRRGIEQFRDPTEVRLDRMLTHPFRDDDASYALDRRQPTQ